MPVEIERRYLVDPSKLPKLLSPTHLRQGYIHTDPALRVRTQGDPYPKAWLTLKGSGTVSRPEFEYEIPMAHALEMWSMVKFGLEKVRGIVPCYEISNVNKHWVVDEFLGRHKGLWLAEIELEGPDDPVVSQPWLGREVTGDHRYSNAWLAEHGLPPV